LKEKPSWQVPVVGSVSASEQNSCDAIVTPSLVIVDVFRISELLSPYDERVRTAMEFAEAETANANTTADTASTLSFSIYPPAQTNQ
jgi:hypothetical protein